MNATTQQGVQTSMEPMSREVRIDHFFLHRKRLKGTWYMDTLIFKVNAILGNTVYNVQTQGKFVKVYHIRAHREAEQSINYFTDNVKVPEMLITYGAGEFTGWNTYFVNYYRRMRIQLHNLEQGWENHNYAAEREI